MMEVRYPHGTLDSTKMSGESLEDQRIAKEPLPLLIRIVIVRRIQVESNSGLHTFLISFVESLYKKRRPSR
jgi:hypothetical protein